MNNYYSKFCKGELVKITLGFYRGKSGKITSYINTLNYGFLNNVKDSGIKTNNCMYEVRIGFFKTVNCTEDQLELIK